MPRNQTKGFLRTRLQQLCDIENDTHLGTTELNRILTSAAAETWDFICSLGLSEKYVKSIDITTTANQLAYDLTSATYVPLQDFYRIHKVYTVESGNQLRALQRIQPSELYSYRPVQSAITIRLYYIPQAPVWSDGTSDDATAVFDGVNGWEEHLLMTACCAVKLKREEDYNTFFRRKKELEERIAKQANVDFGEPIRVSRKRRMSRNPWIPYMNQVHAYGIRGDKLELYYNSGYLVS